MPVIRLVLQHLFEDGCNGRCPPSHLQASGRAGVGTKPASGRAGRFAGRSGSEDGLGISGGADSLAGRAADAARQVQEHLRLRGPGFRIVAPETVQRTALDEYYSSDARSVMHRKFFNIENKS